MTDNEIIAEFMGWTIEGEPEFKKPYEVWKSETGTLMYPRTDPQGNRYPEKFQFHTSWDWLMPVYRKFKNCLIEMHKSIPPNSANKGDLIEVDIHCAVTEVDILKAHKYLVDGIKWYNHQPK